MTSPENLKRNLTILAMYDSGDYSRKAIVRELNLASLDVVRHVIRNRDLYEKDSRITRLFTRKPATLRTNPPLAT